MQSYNAHDHMLRDLQNIPDREVPSRLRDEFDDPEVERVEIVKNKQVISMMTREGFETTMPNRRDKRRNKKLNRRKDIVPRGR
jgi:hypothetical protein